MELFRVHYGRGLWTGANSQNTREVEEEDSASWQTQSLETRREQILGVSKWVILVISTAVNDAAPLVTAALNVAIAGVLLRLTLPRVAALRAMKHLDGRRQSDYQIRFPIHGLRI